jgi:hypothetical protein
MPTRSDGAISSSGTERNKNDQAAKIVESSRSSYGTPDANETSKDRNAPGRDVGYGPQPATKRSARLATKK